MTGKTQNKKRSYVRRRGALQAAEALGVSYGHLRLVVTGQRESKSLLTRYRTWKAGQKGIGK